MSQALQQDLISKHSYKRVSFLYFYHSRPRMYYKNIIYLYSNVIPELFPLLLIKSFIVRKL